MGDLVMPGNTSMGHGSQLDQDESGSNTTTPDSAFKQTMAT